MIIIPRIRPTDSHQNKIFTRVKTFVVYWGFQTVRIRGKPRGKGDGSRDRGSRRSLHSVATRQSVNPGTMTSTIEAVLNGAFECNHGITRVGFVLIFPCVVRYSLEVGPRRPATPSDCSIGFIRSTIAKPGREI